jgi:serine/threonine protein kinase
MDADGWEATEARLGTIAAIRSPYLPALIEAGQTEEDGRTVTWCSRADGVPRPAPTHPVDPATAYRVLAAVGHGLHALHEGGVAHGDLRARAVLHRGGDTLVEPPLHRPAAPALAPGGSPADLDAVEAAVLWGEGPSRAGDIWALGALAHRLLTGSGIHPALGSDQIVTAVQRVLIEPPVISPTLPAPAIEVVRACLAQDPGDRPSTADDVAARFDHMAAVA